MNEKKPEYGRISYENVHRRLQDAIKGLEAEGVEMSVAEVAKRAQVSLSTAYNHKVRDMILNVMMRENQGNQEND